MNNKKSGKSKLSDAQRELIFNEFDRVQQALVSKAGMTYIRRFSEPRKSGMGYRCKWWYAKYNPKTLNAIKLPEGWSLEVVPGYYRNSIALYTSKF